MNGEYFFMCLLRQIRIRTIFKLGHYLYLCNVFYVLCSPAIFIP